MHVKALNFEKLAINPNDSWRYRHQNHTVHHKKFENISSLLLYDVFFSFNVLWKERERESIKKFKKSEMT